MLLPSSKRLVPQSWNTLNGMFQTKHKAEIKLNYFEYSDRKRYLAEPDIVEYDENKRPQYDLILGVNTMKRYGIMLDFKDKMITVDEVKLPMQNINYLQCSSTLRALKLNHSQPSHGTAKHSGSNQTCYADPRYQVPKSRSPVNCQRQMQAPKRRSAKEVAAATHQI
jgi:hypothetical protein